MTTMARPKKDPESKFIAVGFRLDEGDRLILDALEKYAFDRRLSRNSAVTILVESALVAAGYLDKAIKSPRN